MDGILSDRMWSSLISSSLKIKRYPGEAKEVHYAARGEETGWATVHMMNHFVHGWETASNLCVAHRSVIYENLLPLGLLIPERIDSWACRLIISTSSKYAKREWRREEGNEGLLSSCKEQFVTGLFQQLRKMLTKPSLWIFFFFPPLNQLFSLLNDCCGKVFSTLIYGHNYEGPFQNGTWIEKLKENYLATGN